MSFLIRNSKLVTLLLAVSMAWVLSVSAFAAPASSTRTVARKHSSSTKRSARKTRRHRSSRNSWRHRGQHGIQAARAREIQEALIREKYLKGEADGVWGADSEAAMARYQADNGWQSKVVPDARALIKLGLGPDRTSVINPESLQSSLQPQPRGGQD